VRLACDRPESGVGLRSTLSRSFAGNGGVRIPDWSSRREVVSFRMPKRQTLRRLSPVVAGAGASESRSCVTRSV
jgi:hypothetical protein